MATWQRLLARSDVGARPRRDVWSPFEYACHVRDVYRLFDARLHLMLDEDDPRFSNWDQDDTAVADRYWEQDPAGVCAAAERRRRVRRWGEQLVCERLS